MRERRERPSEWGDSYPDLEDEPVWGDEGWGAVTEWCETCGLRADECECRVDP